MRISLSAGLPSVVIFTAAVIYLNNGTRIALRTVYKTTLYWKLRSWLWNDPIPPTSTYHSLWNTCGDYTQQEVFVSERERFVRSFRFLAPFFRSEGYYPYVRHTYTDVNDPILVPDPVGPRHYHGAAFPFALSEVNEERELNFDFFAPAVWPARDQEGREVIIKAVADHRLSPQYLASRALCSPEIRDHPANHCIPILDVLDFQGHKFVVMPRWSLADDADFTTVGELLRFGCAFFEAVYFCHKNGIAHGDCTAQNYAADILPPSFSGPFAQHYAGIRGPERRYALIDFGAAKLSRSFYSDRDFPDEHLTNDGEMKAAYQRDVRMLAASTGSKLRCLASAGIDASDLFQLLDDMLGEGGTPIPEIETVLLRLNNFCDKIEEDIGKRVVEVHVSRSAASTGKYHPRCRVGEPIYLM